MRSLTTLFLAALSLAACNQQQSPAPQASTGAASPAGAASASSASSAASTPGTPNATTATSATSAPAAASAPQMAGAQASAAAAASPAGETVTFKCSSGETVTVTFFRQPDMAVLSRGDQRFELPSQRPASGMWYAKGEVELRGKGDRIDIEMPGAKPLACQAAAR